MLLSTHRPRAFAGAIVLFALSAGITAIAQERDEPEQPAPEPETEVPVETPGQDSEPGEASLVGVDWFPLEVGRRWTYRVSFSARALSADAEAEDEDGETEDASSHVMEVYVTDPQSIEGRSVAALEWKLDQQLAQREFYIVEDGELQCVRRIQGYGANMKEWNLQPPQPCARETLAVGDTWTWEGNVNATAGNQTVTVLREERVSTESGRTFETLVVQIDFEGEDDSRGTTTRWLCAGVGIVREVCELRTVDGMLFQSEGELIRWTDATSGQ
jgi:hypothetical protein